MLDLRRVQFSLCILKVEYSIVQIQMFLRKVLEDVHCRMLLRGRIDCFGSQVGKFCEIAFRFVLRVC